MLGLLNKWASVDDIATVELEVDSDQEVSVITDCECKQPGGGRALLFKKVKGSDLTLATNLFGSANRARAVWGKETPDILADRLRHALQKASGDTCQQRLDDLLCSTLLNRAGFQQLQIPQAMVNLNRLPAIKSWPGDGGFYLTLGLACMRSPDTGAINWGIYRMQVLDKSSVAIHFLPHSRGAKLVQMAEFHKQDLPVAVSFGGNPALLTAAALPLPDGVDEAAFVEFLTGHPLNMAQGTVTGLPIPNDAEIVLEGVIRPNDFAQEGPFGNHTGFYRPAAPAPVLRIAAFYSYEDAICPATVVGPPPMENIQFIKANEALILALLQVDYPQIRDLSYFVEGVFHGCVVVAVDKTETTPLELARQLWEKGPLQRSKLLILVDGDEGLSLDSSTLFWRIINQVDVERDLLLSKARMAVDATRKNTWRRVRHDLHILNKVLKRWHDYGL